MQRVHMHTPDWVYRHKPNWHTIGIRLEHIIHDPHFWATLALAILLGLMILTAIFTARTGETPVRPVYPGYPYSYMS